MACPDLNTQSGRPMKKRESALYFFEVLAIIAVLGVIICYPIAFLVYTALKVTGAIW